MTEEFSITSRVYYDNTDAEGVVYHSRYLDICERARTEFLRSKGITQSTLLETFGIGFVVKNARLNYIKPAKLDDLLNIKVILIEDTGIILKLKQEIFLTSRQNINVDNELLFELTIDIVCVNKYGKPIRIPKDISNYLK